VRVLQTPALPLGHAATCEGKHRPKLGKNQVYIEGIPKGNNDCVLILNPETGQVRRFNAPESQNAKEAGNPASLE
jgi:hypothetical protein